MVRIYTPDNATILKGSLRNLLDGSRSSSIKHFINKIETIHQNFFSDYDEYSMNDFLPLYKKGATLVIYNGENYLLNHNRSLDADFIIVNGSTVRGYNNNSGECAFHLDQYRLNDSDSDLADVENFLDSFWRFLPAGWNRTSLDNFYSAAVLAFDPASGALLIPESLACDIFDGDINDAGFTFFKEEKPLDNVAKQAVSSNTQTVNVQTTENKGNNTMSKVTAIVAANKSAAATAAKLEAGKVALTQLTKVAAKALPSGMAGMFAKQYLDTPVGRVVVANLLNLAIEQYAPNNQKARIVAKAAMDAAMLEVVQSFNISEMIDKAIEGINIDALTANISEE